MYDKPIKEVFAELNTSEKGLSEHEAGKRLLQYGPNSFKEDGRVHPLRIFIAQFKSPIIWILLLAIIICLVVKEYLNFYVISAIVVLNAVLGFVQEYRAEGAIANLKKLISLKATVIRDDTEKQVDASELVPGDIILLETGDKISADARLIDIINFQTQEASLTGESIPVKKKLGFFRQATAVADRLNMVFSGTIVTHGRAKAVVADTGMNTQIGNIAKMIQEAETPLTPLQKKLAHLGKFLGIIVIAIAVVVFLLGIIKGNPAMAMFLAAIALAVAAIPEGLPAVVTVSLALGVQKMARHNALIRKLPSVETLGACTVICSDKTGTLTHNQMTVTKLFVNNQVVAVTGSGYSPSGSFSQAPKSFAKLLKAGVLNNNASLRLENSEWIALGDPTEAALLVTAKKAGIDTAKLQEDMPRISEIEFTSERKLMTTVHEEGSKNIAYTKGAPEEIVQLCSRILVNGKIYHFRKEAKQKVLEQNEQFANDALRILGFAYKEIEPKEEIEKDMIFIGLQAMIDPPRQEVKKAIKKCEAAGIRVIMITGDHMSTAAAIAREIGISGKAISGIDLDSIENLEDAVEKIAVYARVNPAHKIRIIEALKKKGHIVAMTGDGVNDAPALKKADLGIAMGITGTDVAKEASGMILADDNFASIVSAVEQGRTIFSNITKFVEYLLSSNIGEVFTVLAALLFGMPLPLIALQILWINLVTDGAPALALGAEPPEKGVMSRPPRKVEEKIVNKKRGILIFLIGLMMMAGTLIMFEIYNPDLNLNKARTVAFTTLVMFQLFNVLNQRSENESLFRLGVFSNKWLIGAIILSLSLQLAVIYIPFISSLFSLVPLALADWVLITLVSSSVLAFGEIVKLLKI